MFGTYVKYAFQRTYDAILAAPVDVEERVPARVAVDVGPRRRLRLRPAGRRDLLRLDPAWGMLTVPFIAFVSGFGWANFGIMVAGYSKSIDNFSYIVSAVITPLFLVAGTFFPLDGLPQWVQVLGGSTRCTTASSSSGTRSSASRVGRTWAASCSSSASASLTWRIAIRAMTRKLID